MNFKNTIIIMTSNIGSNVIKDTEEKEAIEQKINDAMKIFFRPEFLNRIDEVVIFNRLSKEDIRRIVDIQLKGLEERLQEKHVTLKLTDKAKDLLGIKGYDVVYGARPLKRLVQKQIQDKIALKLLKGEIKEKGRVSIDAANEELVFSCRKQRL